MKHTWSNLHEIKCETEYYQAVEQGRKKFEFHKNGRDYKFDDTAHLYEVVQGIPTERIIELEIKYILYGLVFGLPEGYCIFNW